MRTMKCAPKESRRRRERPLARREQLLPNGDGIIVSAVQPAGRDHEVRLQAFTKAPNGRQRRTGTVWRLSPRCSNTLQKIVFRVCEVSLDRDQDGWLHRRAAGYLHGIEVLARIGTVEGTVRVRTMGFYGLHQDECRVVLEHWTPCAGGETLSNGERVEIPIADALSVAAALRDCYEACTTVA